MIVGNDQYNFELSFTAIFVVSFLITLNAILLQSCTWKERADRLGKLAGVVLAPHLNDVEYGNRSLWFAALLYSIIVAIIAAMVIAFGFLATNTTKIELTRQIIQALLFVIIPAYFAGVLRIYIYAVHGSLSEQSFLEGTTNIVLACLCSSSIWLLLAIPGGLFAVSQEFQPYGLVLSFFIGCMPSLTLLTKYLRNQIAVTRLSGVRGLDRSHSEKLYEAGVRNLNNLANADPGALFTRTGMQLLWIVEWIAEAQLRVLVGDADHRRSSDGASQITLADRKSMVLADARDTSAIQAELRLAALRRLGVNNILDLAKALERSGEFTWEVVRALSQPLEEDDLEFATPASVRSIIENSPSYRVLTRYVSAVEKAETPVNDVVRAVEAAFQGQPLSNYQGFVRLSVAKQPNSDANICECNIRFSTEGKAEEKEGQEEQIAEVAIVDGESDENPASSDSLAGGVDFDVRIIFRPATIPSISLKFRAPSNGDSEPQFFEARAAKGRPIEILVRILQANRLIQSLIALVPDEESDQNSIAPFASSAVAESSLAVTEATRILDQDSDNASPYDFGARGALIRIEVDEAPNRRAILRLFAKNDFLSIEAKVPWTRLESIRDDLAKELYQSVRLTDEMLKQNNWEQINNAVSCLQSVGSRITFDLLDSEGDKAFWDFIDKHFHSRFGGNEIDEPTELYKPPLIEVESPDEFIPFEILPSLASPPPQVRDLPSLRRAMFHFLGMRSIIRHVGLPSRNRNADGGESQQSAEGMVLWNREFLPLKFFYDSSLPGALTEKSFFDEHARHIQCDGPWPTVSTTKENVHKVLASALRDPHRRLSGSLRGDDEDGDQVHHFSCHCDTNSESVSDYSIKVRSGSIGPFKVVLNQLKAALRDARRLSSKPVTAAKPLLFLNACGSVAGSPKGLPAFPQTFADSHRTIIGTETKIPDSVAAIVAQEFYLALLGGANAGDSLFKAKWHLVDMYYNPLGVLYTLHGEPGLRVSSPVSEYADR